MTKQLFRFAGFAVLGLAFTACGNGNGGTVLTPQPPSRATSYIQFERLSRPAIKEVFEPFQDHQVSNGLEPYQDTTIQNDIVATTNTVRPPNTTIGTNYGKTLASVLYPDEYLVNLAGSTPASGTYFLSADINPANFGGRAPNDDVIGLELGVVFGSTLHTLGLVQPDDREENNCLSTQNLGGTGQPVMDPSKKSTNAFPYLANAH